MNLNARQLRLTVYELKKQYGRTVTILRAVSVNTNVDTGAQSSPAKSVTVKAAVVPAQMVRRWSHMDPDTARNQGFAYGGDYDVKDKGFILATRDLNDVKVDIRSWAVLDSGEVYRVKSVKEYLDEVIGFVGEELEGSAKTFVQDLNDKIGFGDAAVPS